jgi:DNA repair exonuclease SbcCD ATPase subunit
MRSLAIGFALALASCSSYDNSSDTDRSRSAVTNAQSAVKEKTGDVTTRANDLEREKRELVQRQQKLVDDETALAAKRQQLGSARETLVEARATYTTAVNARLSKLDATLATLATRTDAASKDAAVGLRARREQLAVKVSAMSATPEQDWAAYTKDVDTTFDAIERDASR